MAFWLSCRYVRQDSPLWRALHAGVLTSSTLNGALGLYEPAAVARLGLPKHFVSHRSLAAAVANLQQPQHEPPPPAHHHSPAEADRLNRCALWSVLFDGSPKDEGALLLQACQRSQ